MRLSGWLAGSACVVTLAAFAAGSANAQISVYAQFSADQMTNLQTSKTGFGSTFGVQDAFYRHGPLRVSADLRGFYYNGKAIFNGANRFNLAGVGVGPKISYAGKHVEPYAEVAVGFARFNDGLGNRNSGTTDSQVDAIFGLDIRLTPRFDLRAFEFDYKRYSALGGEFNPKVISAGVVYHLGRK